MSVWLLSLFSYLRNLYINMGIFLTEKFLKRIDPKSKKFDVTLGPIKLFMFDSILWANNKITIIFFSFKI